MLPSTQENFKDLPDDKEAPALSDDDSLGDGDLPLLDRVRATPTPCPDRKLALAERLGDDHDPKVIEGSALENDKAFGIPTDPLEGECIFGLKKKLKKQEQM